MSTATTVGNISTSSRILSLGLGATDTRKALHILALSDALISPFFRKSEPATTANKASEIKAASKAQ
jgi:hypothetical protein